MGQGSKRSQVSPFIVMDIMREANELEAKGKSIIHMEVGQPSTSAPRQALRTAEKVLLQERLGYTEALGDIDLRKKISQFYIARYNLEIDFNRIIVTTGASGGLQLAFLSLFDAGDRVALTEPCYPGYRNMLSSMNIEIEKLSIGPEYDFRLNVEVLEKMSNRIDGLIMSSPGNPTGSMTKAEQLKLIVSWCQENQVKLISDEIYHGIEYEEPAITAVNLDNASIVINSFSKYFSMTGWRLGWMVVPENMIRTIERLAQNLFISPPTISQLAALGSLDSLEELNQTVARYKKNRELMISRLPEFGLSKFAPIDGAFYAYVDVSSLADNSEIFCREMLREIGVAITPGIDFDRENGMRYVRFCFSGLTEEINEAMNRLSNWLN
ncbi:MAG: 1-aminocyclopropane-1-carboxylate deaminase [Alphaproteobacteria bacterium]|nr:1-aminocyclopropane-1-carboxylate deaminase [Alphaproteobacteria bacterium]